MKLVGIYEWILMKFVFICREQLKENTERDSLTKLLSQNPQHSNPNHMHYFKGHAA